jgi:hypothetical protein
MAHVNKLTSSVKLKETKKILPPFSFRKLKRSKKCVVYIYLSIKKRERCVYWKA